MLPEKVRLLLATVLLWAPAHVSAAPPVAPGIVATPPPATAVKPAPLATHVVPAAAPSHATPTPSAISRRAPSTTPSPGASTPAIPHRLAARIAQADPKLTVSPKKPATVAADTFVRNGVRDPARDGSNGGQWFKDGAGSDWFGKPGKGDATELDRMANERIVSRIYNVASSTFRTKAPEVRWVTIDGRPYLMSKKIPLSSSSTFTQEQLKRFGDGFVVDAWLANWDIGESFQLVADTSGQLVRIDGGGGGLFRARGAPKGAAFGNEVTELQTMRDPARSSSYAFRSLSDADVKVGLEKFATWYPQHRAEIESAIDDAGMAPSTANELKAKLAARAAWLIEQARK